MCPKNISVRYPWIACRTSALGTHVIAGPTVPEPAFRLGEKSDDPMSIYLSDIFTVSANLTGSPGISIPCGLVGGLPVGLQLVGRPLDEATLLRVSDVFQRQTDHHEQSPPEFS